MAYPVKYAAMPVIVLKEWDSCLGKNRNEVDIYYIASRCHVLSETRRYFASSSGDISYKVKFPYSISQEVEPSICVTNGCESYVERVYNEDELEVLKAHLLEINKKLLSKRMYLTNYDSDKIYKLINSYQEMALEYSLLENELEVILEEEMPFNKSLVRK